jgi:iron complex outermembrane receptor protein
LFGASAGYGFRSPQGEGRVFAGIGNLLDRQYIGSVIVNETSGRYYEPAPGRTFEVGFSWRWHG